MDNPNDIPQGTTPQSHDTSIQAVRLAERNRRKETMVQSIPDDASPAPASTATAFTSTAASATTATTATTAAVEEQEQRDFAVVGGSPKTVAVDATAARGTAPTSAPPSPPPSKKIKSKKGVAYFDPASNEEVYEWNGIWYLTSGAGPVGKPWRRPRWSQEERDGDWRPTVAEEEKYNAWYDAYCPTERYTTETSADKCAYDNAVEKGMTQKSYTHSDIRFNYYDPSSMEEVYEFDGVWYLVNGYRPVGHPWRRHGTDWRPTPAEDEEYQTWYKAFTATVIKINKEA